MGRPRRFGFTLDSRINAVRKAIGDSGEQQELVRTIPRKGIRFVGSIEERKEQAEMPAQSSAFRAQTGNFILPIRRQDQHRICRGRERPALIKAANWLTHLEYDWESPIWSPLLQRLAEKNHLIRYDTRGTGLSDRKVAEISFDGFVRDF